MVFFWHFEILLFFFFFFAVFCHQLLSVPVSVFVLVVFPNILYHIMQHGQLLIYQQQQQVVSKHWSRNDIAHNFLLRNQWCVARDRIYRALIIYKAVSYAEVLCLFCSYQYSLFICSKHCTYLSYAEKLLKPVLKFFISSFFKSPRVFLHLIMCITFISSLRQQIFVSLPLIMEIL